MKREKKPSIPANAGKIRLKGNHRSVLIVVCAVLAVMVWVVFGQTTKFDFVNFDDGQYISDNSTVKAGVTAGGLASAFDTRSTDNWVPLTTISHMLDCQFYGLKAGGHHLTNVLLHMAGVILLFLALERMTRRHDVSARQGGGGEIQGNVISSSMTIWLCAFVAAVFAAHPLRAESVGWVSERKDVLCGVFFMLTLWCYAGYVEEVKRQSGSRVRSPHPGISYRYFVTLFFGACALMSKPVAVTLPFVLLLLDYWPLGRFPSPHPAPLPSHPMGAERGQPASKSSFKQEKGKATVLWLIAEKIPFLILSVASCLPTILTERQGITATTVVPIPLRIENAIVSYVTYIGELFYPTNLAAFYYYPITGIPAGKVAGALLFLGGVTLTVFYCRKRHPYLLTGWLWYLVMLVPVIGLVQVGSQAHADRHTYLSEIGLCVMLTWLAGDLCSAMRHRAVILGGLSGVILAILIYSGHRQVSYWQNGGTLWSHAVECDPNDVRAYYDLANYLEGKNDLEGAITNYQMAIKIDPGLVGAHNNLGMVYAAKGDTDDAMALYRATIKLDPDYAVAHYNLGSALLKKKETDAAIAEFRTALAIDPAHSEMRSNPDLALPSVNAAQMKVNYSKFHSALGSALEWKGDVDGAIAEYQEALKLDPNNSQASYNLANDLLKKGQVGQGVTQFQNALKNGADDAKTRNNLGTALRREGRLDDAIVQYQEALKIDPDYAPAHYNLGNALLQKGQVDGAIAEYQAALKLKPDNAMVQRNIAHTIWALATSPDASLRNGSNAVAFATEANQTASDPNPLILRVLAAAYAETGNFPQAIETAKKAVGLAEEQQNLPLQTVLQKDLSGYQTNSPVRAEPEDMEGW